MIITIILHETYIVRFNNPKTLITVIKHRTPEDKQENKEEHSNVLREVISSVVSK